MSRLSPQGPLLSQFAHEFPWLFTEYFLAHGGGFFPELFALPNQAGHYALHWLFAAVLFAALTQEPFQHVQVMVFAEPVFQLAEPIDHRFESLGRDRAEHLQLVIEVFDLLAPFVKRL